MELTTSFGPSGQNWSVKLRNTCRCYACYVEADLQLLPPKVLAANLVKLTELYPDLCVFGGHLSVWMDGTKLLPAGTNDHYWVQSGGTFW